jgi:diadenosine tetraphosphate (Ap4A) HIT family hydrolase
MSEFVLDERLCEDCIWLMQTENIHILLMNNALVPWFILVPQTSSIELHHLHASQFDDLMSTQLLLARFVESHFAIDKINIGAIGNMVSQLHVHVIGRHRDDHCWPNVIWGNPKKTAYTEERIRDIQQMLVAFCKENNQASATISR